MFKLSIVDHAKKAETIARLGGITLGRRVYADNGQTSYGRQADRYEDGQIARWVDRYYLAGILVHEEIAR